MPFSQHTGWYVEGQSVGEGRPVPEAVLDRLSRGPCSRGLGPGHVFWSATGYAISTHSWVFLTFSKTWGGCSLSWGFHEHHLEASSEFWWNGCQAFWWKTSRQCLSARPSVYQLIPPTPLSVLPELGASSPREPLGLFIHQRVPLFLPPATASVLSFLGPHLQHMEVPRRGVQSEL